jgi:anthranilate phosphoribosyltransferase
MAEEVKTEMVKETPEGEKPTTEQPAKPIAEMVQISATELEDIRAALKKANGEAAKYRKTAEQVEVERKAKEEAEMTALQKAEARAKDLEAQLNGERHARLQAAVAAKVGLPAQLADRLKGETAEELEADAKAIKELIPAQPAQKPASPGIVTNPGTNGGTGESDMSRRARLGL